MSCGVGKRILQPFFRVSYVTWRAAHGLDESGLKSRRPATGPELLQQHHVERLRFAHNHDNWNLGEWRRVLFTDESRFTFRSPDGRERAWRRE